MLFLASPKKADFLTVTAPILAFSVAVSRQSRKIFSPDHQPCYTFRLFFRHGFTPGLRLGLFVANIHRKLASTD